MLPLTRVIVFCPININRHSNTPTIMNMHTQLHTRAHTLMCLHTLSPIRTCKHKLKHTYICTKNLLNTHTHELTLNPSVPSYYIFLSLTPTNILLDEGYACDACISFDIVMTSTSITSKHYYL